jgi:hypothetical protein
VVIVPIVKKEADQEGVTQAVDALYAAAQQAGLRCKLDASTEKTPGWKFNHYEMKVPLWPVLGTVSKNLSCCLQSWMKAATLPVASTLVHRLKPSVAIVQCRAQFTA